jgi:hypothetical protein
VSTQETRRQFTRRLAGAAAALVSPVAQAESQERPAEEDPRIGSLGKVTHLTPDQRKALPNKLKEIDEGGAALREVELPDGAAEPAFTFDPVRESSKRTQR